MHLIEELERRLETEQSVFRAQLLREDLARLSKLRAMARDGDTLAAFVKEGLYIGWTQGDFRTHELKTEIETVLAALYAYETGGRTDELDTAVRGAWQAFDRERMEKLIGCL